MSRVAEFIVRDDDAGEFWVCHCGAEARAGEHVNAFWPAQVDGPDQCFQIIADPAFDDAYWMCDQCGRYCRAELTEPATDPLLTNAPITNRQRSATVAESGYGYRWMLLPIIGQHRGPWQVTPEARQIYGVDSIEYEIGTPGGLLEAAA